ncbi:MAG: NUDIX hydrolase [Aristaeellaceae bacterium]
MDDMRSQSLEGLMTLLQGGNNQAAYAACQAIEAMCAESDAPYRYTDEFIRLLDSSSSLERNRGLALTAAVARWDWSGRLDGAIGKYLACLRDPKPITVRQCIQHMPRLARGKPQLQQQLADGLVQADFSGYAGSMRPLLEKDRMAALDEITAAMQEMNFQQRLEARVLYESSWETLYGDRVRMPGGGVIPTYHRLHLPQPSVSVVIRDGAGRYLLIRSKRYVTGQVAWETPAGRVEPGESPEEAARRECMEETGCDVGELTRLCVHCPANGNMDMTMHVFSARVSGENGEDDPDEVAGKAWFTPVQVEAMLQGGDITCGVTMTALLYSLHFVP